MATSPVDQQNSFIVSAIRQIDSAVMAHVRWVADFNKSLICGSPMDPSVQAPDGYRTCPFGQWLYADRPKEWDEWSAEFDHVESLHRAMHDNARALVKEKSGGAIAPANYDLFMEASLRFRFALRALSFRLIDEICLIDQLTGVWNRSSMFKRLNEEQDRTLRSNQPCSICMMDLDHFKRINDTHGHIAGDKVLQAVMEIASRRLRAYDAIFRYGGEEFLFCLPNATTDIATEAMERLRQRIADTDIVLRDGVVVRVTASFGVAPLSATQPIETSMEEADRALFTAKAKGRNSVCRWDVQ
jgi:diguanylate cyclase (GGDEF)-like protein